MHIGSKEMARAQVALQQALGTCLYDRTREVNLIDFAQYEKNGQTYDRLALRFHVEYKISETQLETFGREPLQNLSFLGFPNMVTVSKPRLHQWTWPGGWYRPGGWRRASSNPHRSRADPLRGGVSVSTDFSGSGTLGGIVRDRATGREMLLSNWHVLVVYWGARPGQRIRQPGRDDGGTYADVIATLDRDAMSADLDAAVAVLNDRRDFINQQLSVGSVRGVGRARLGMEVEKSGRSSRWTSGRVTGIGGVARLRYSRIKRVIRNVVTIDQLGGEVSTGGDSGSWWLDSTTNEAVGLHFAGSNNPERGLAMDMQSVLDALNVDIFM